MVTLETPHTTLLKTKRYCCQGKAPALRDTGRDTKRFGLRATQSSRQAHRMCSRVAKHDTPRHTTANLPLQCVSIQCVNTYILPRRRQSAIAPHATPTRAALNTRISCHGIAVRDWRAPSSDSISVSPSCQQAQTPSASISSRPYPSSQASSETDTHNCHHQVHKSELLSILVASKLWEIQHLRPSSEP